MSFNATTFYLILVFAAVFSAAQAAFGLLTQARARKVVNQRLKVAERVAGIQELVLELRKQRGLTVGGELKAGLRWLSELIVRSGVPYDGKRWLMAVIAAVVVGAVGGFLLTHKLWAIPAGTVILGIGGPILFLKFMAGRRSKALGVQLPQALDIIVRSLEAGHPVPTAISLVGREMADPIASEFGMAADEISYGATLEQAVERMAVRCQHLDVDLFAATVRLQERAGGNLTGLLKLNANTVRERHRMRLKIQAASSEGRVSAAILTAAPFIAGAAIQVLNPDYYGKVINEPVIRYTLMGFGVWITIGNLVMRKMVDMRI